MSRNYYLPAVVILFAVWTSGLQAMGKMPPKEPIKAIAAESLPVKPSEKIIRQKLSFNAWIDQGFTELKEKISYSKARELRQICLQEGGLFVPVVSDGRTLEDLDALIGKLEAMQKEDSPYMITFAQTFLPLVKQTRQEVYRFLTINTVYEGLEEKSKPDKMIAHWCRYGYLYAHDPDKVGPLFSREFRKKIYANQYPVSGDETYDPRSIYDFLEEFLEVYYDVGIKIAKLQVFQEFGVKDSENRAAEFKLMSRAFEVMKSTLGPLTIQIDKQTRIVQENKEQGGFMWKFEENAWRFNGSVMPNTKNQ